MDNQHVVEESDRWKQHVGDQLEDLKSNQDELQADFRRSEVGLREDIERLQDRFIEHLTTCHPKIIEAQQEARKRTDNLEYRYMLLTAFGIGMGTAFGWGLREILDFLWLR